MKLYGIEVSVVKRSKDERGRDNAPKFEADAMEVTAKHPTTAIRLAYDSAARRHKVSVQYVELQRLRLMRTGDWKSERVIKIH